MNHHRVLWLGLLGLASCFSPEPGAVSTDTTQAETETTAEMCVDGNEGCPCFANGTCNAGLDCLSNLCVDSSGGTTSGPTTESTASTTLDVETSGVDTTTDTTDGDESTSATASGTTTGATDGSSDDGQGSTGAADQCGNGDVEGDEECDDGNRVDDATCLADCRRPPPPNVVFVTANGVAANMGGLAGADEICTSAAAAANLPGERFVAWLSTSNVNARDRLEGSSGWVRPDGQPFAATAEGIVAGEIWFSPTVDENGEDVGGAELWTGSTAQGTFDAQNGACSDWTSLANVSTTYGMASGSFGSLSTAPNPFTRSCERNSLRLLCLGVDHEAFVTPPSAEGRLAFVSSTALRGSAGVDAFDEVCRSEANAAGHDGSFVAAVTIDDQPPSARLNIDGPPWVRFDGTPLWTDASDLAQGDPALAAILQTATGEPVNDLVWTGSSGFAGTNPACDPNWTGSDATSFGIVGVSSSAGVNAAAFDGEDCVTPRPVYCFEN